MESGSLFRGAIPAVHLERTCHVALHNVLQHDCQTEARIQIKMHKKVSAKVPLASLLLFSLIASGTGSCSILTLQVRI